MKRSQKHWSGPAVANHRRLKNHGATIQGLFILGRKDYINREISWEKLGKSMVGDDADTRMERHHNQIYITKTALPFPISLTRV